MGLRYIVLVQISQMLVAQFSPPQCYKYMRRPLAYLTLETGRRQLMELAASSYKPPTRTNMAIKLRTDYSKKLGLPGYSSHSFSASIEVEISSLEHAPREIAELYQTLQQNVDEQIQDPGFIPPGTYGIDTSAKSQQNGALAPQQPSNIRHINGAWKCSDKQRELILKVISEKNLDKQYVEQLAREGYAKGVRQLSKLEASSFIELLFKEGGNSCNKRVQDARR